MPDALADTQQQHQDLASEVEVAPYNNRDPVSGAPLPLAPDLVTLSLLPRSHWDSLTRIEVGIRCVCVCVHLAGAKDHYPCS